jgi:regulator of RNase E activity RraB
MTISLEILEEMFRNIARTTDWDMNKPMLWGYLFTHREQKLLDKAKNDLVKNGYEFVDIHLAEKEQENESDVWCLHVQKKEKHDANTLYLRNQELENFADKFSLYSYDGMDCSPII